jgi:hypothetical protein
MLASQSGASAASHGQLTTGAAKAGRRRRAVSSPSKADAAAATRRDADDDEPAASAPPHHGHTHLSDYLKFMKAGSWRSLANSIRQKVSGLREQRHPKALGSSAQVNFSVNLPPEQVRDAAQQALLNLEGAHTKVRGYRFHTTIRHSPFFREEVKVLVEVCRLFGPERTETGLKISRVKGEMAACVTASREIVAAVKRLLPGEAGAPLHGQGGPADAAAAGGSVAQANRVSVLRPEEDGGRRRSNSDAPQKVAAHFRNPQPASNLGNSGISRNGDAEVSRGHAASTESLERSLSSSSSSSLEQQSGTSRHVTFLV